MGNGIMGHRVMTLEELLTLMRRAARLTNARTIWFMLARTHDRAPVDSMIRNALYELLTQVFELEIDSLQEEIEARANDMEDDAEAAMEKLWWNPAVAR